MAMNTSSGLPNRPRNPRPKASAWPILAAISVARGPPTRIATSACKTRPPSIGKAGIRLKTARKMLAIARRPISDRFGLSIWVSSSGRTEPTIAISTRPIARLTAGPASATTSSWEGSLGSRWRLATPPIGNSVTSGVPMP